MSSSLLFLCDNDFSIKQGSKGNIMCHNIPGICLVLFFSNQCPHCNDVFPVFKNLPQVMPGCQFAGINVSKYPNVVKLSGMTIAPLTHVPYIVLYINGVPFMKYNGGKTLNEIATFLTEVITKINEKRSFKSGSNSSSSSGISMKDDPDYAFGVPFNVVCEGEQCYLSFEEAYKKK